MVDNQPSNLSLLNTNKYQLVFPAQPNLNFFAYSVTLPGVYTNAAPQNSPFVDMNRHGDKVSYDPLTLTVLVDENMEVWRNMWAWLKGLTFPKNFSQYIKNNNPDPDLPKGNGLYMDAILIVNTNANNNNLRFHFYNCHPISIGSILFDNSTNPEISTYCDFTFMFDYYDVEKINT